MRLALFLLTLSLIGCEGKARKPAPGAEKEPAQEAVMAGADPVAPTPAGAPPAIAPEGFGALTPIPALDGAHRVAVVGEGAEAVIVAGGLGFVRFIQSGSVRGEVPVTGGVQVLEVFDVDGDSHPEVVVAAGRFRGAADAPASVLVIEPKSPYRQQALELPESPRGQVVAIDRASSRPGDLYIGHFIDKFHVAVHRFQREGVGWKREEVARDRMLFHFAAVAEGQGPWPIAGGRLYGEDADTPGGVTVYRGEARTEVPSLRGARAIAFGGRGEIVFSDGWHKNYGQKAVALVSRASRGADGWRREVLVNIAGRSGFDRLRVADLDGDGSPEVVASGLGPALAVGPGRAQSLSEEASSDAYPANLDGDPELEVVIVGPRSGVWNAP